MSQISVEALAALLNYCEKFAQRMLYEAGEFHPFGAFIDSNGELAALGGHLGEEVPKGAALYEFLESAIAEMARQGTLRAYALAANVSLPESLASPYPDGVRVHVEAAGYSRLVFTPYRLLPYRAIRKFLAVVPTVSYLEPVAVDVPSKVFAAEQP